MVLHLFQIQRPDSDFYRSTNWPTFLQWAISSHNHDYMKALGGVRPIDVVEPINGDVILAEIRKSKDITLPKSNSEVEQQKRLQEVQNDPKYEFFQPGRFVLLDIPKERPEKESTLKRFAPYIVKNIDTRQKKRKNLPMKLRQTANCNFVFSIIFTQITEGCSCSGSFWKRRFGTYRKSEKHEKILT